MEGLLYRVTGLFFHKFAIYVAEACAAISVMLGSMKTVYFSS
jgi:hypothetical protein